MNLSRISEHKDVLVTGGAGLVGSNLDEVLLQSGANVTVLDDLSSGRQEFIDPYMKNKNFRFVKGDLLDRELLKKIMKETKPTLVIHLAANPDISKGWTQTDLDLKLGPIMTYGLLEECRLNDVKDMIFSSSSAVYGFAETLPTQEDYGPLKPASYYGAAKLACEGLVTAFGHMNGMNYWIYRFANVIGRNSRKMVVWDFVQKLKKNPNELEVLGDGKQCKSYIDVMDVANAMVYIYENSRKKENIFNIATDDRIEIMRIAELVIKSMGLKAKISPNNAEYAWPGDVPNTFISNKKLRELGFKPRFNKSEDAVQNFINMLVSGL